MPNPENREATHVKMQKGFKEPPIAEYRDSLGAEEFRQVKCLLRVDARRASFCVSHFAPAERVLCPLRFPNQTKIEEKAFQNEKALEQKLEAAPAGIDASALIRNESPGPSRPE